MIIDMEQRCEELLKKIEENCAKASQSRNLIKKLKADAKKAVSVDSDPISIVDEEDDDAIVQDEVDDFEEELSFYLDSYKGLDSCFTEDDLLDILPNRKHYDYKKIIIRLQAESIKEIKEINELIIEESLQGQDLEDCKTFLKTEQRKIELLKKALIVKDEDEVAEKIPNKIILVPTASGNVRIIEDLERIPSEYYPLFLEILNSIIDGTFKGVKKFINNNNIVGIYEVKEFKVRILFSKIAKDTYAIITALVKKTDKNSIYKDNVTQKAIQFNSTKQQLIECLNNEEFLALNDKNISELFRLLDQKDDAKVFKKGDLND